VDEIQELWKQAIEKIKPDTRAFQILIYLAFSNAPCKPAEISKATGLPSGTIRPTIRSLLRMGFVSQEPGGLYKSKIPFTEIISDMFQRIQKK
jgi:DNA-binding IclR family transcriptional regulator